MTDNKKITNDIDIQLDKNVEIPLEYFKISYKSHKKTLKKRLENEKLDNKSSSKFCN